jgi:uncharacterized iron-regulated membrane protein
MLNVRSVLLKIHRWIALAIFLWVVGVAISGTILAFRAPLEAVLHPHSYLVKGPPQDPDFDRIDASIAARYPDRKIAQYHRDGIRPDEAMLVNLTRRSTPTDPVDIQARTFNPIFDADIEVAVAPATGEILGERPFLNWMRLVYDFHTTLLIPIAGKSYMGLLGIALFFVALSGIVYWWPRAGYFRKSLRIVTDRGGRRILKDVHAVGGAVIAILLLLSTLTGILMSYEFPIQNALRSRGLAISTSPPPQPPVPAGTVLMTDQQTAEAAMRAYPGKVITQLFPPSGGRARSLVLLFPRNPAERIWSVVEAHISAIDGKVLSAFDTDRQPWTNSYVIWLIFFHNGQMFGTVGRVVVALEGIVLLMLTITGPWMWVLRRRKAWARALWGGGARMDKTGADKSRVVAAPTLRPGSDIGWAERSETSL